MTEITHAGFVVKLSEKLTADEENVLREYLSEIRRARIAKTPEVAGLNKYYGKHYQLGLLNKDGVELSYVGYARQRIEATSPQGWLYFPEAGAGTVPVVAEFVRLFKSGVKVHDMEIGLEIGISTGVMPVLRTEYFVGLISCRADI